MIVWINGSFGSGKTQTAYELQRRIPNSYVFDPEEAGFYIKKNLPDSLALNDFQDYGMWRQINSQMLLYLHKYYDGVVLVPMTVTNAKYLEEITAGLKAAGVDFHHVTLAATKETLMKRLRGRGEKRGSWVFDQVERCVHRLSDVAFGKHIQTDELTIDQVVEEVARVSGLSLEDDHRSGFVKKLHRLSVWKRHMRLFG